MGLTAAQRRLMEADERLRNAEREVSQEPEDAQAQLRYAVEYLRNHPEIAKEAGINAFTPEDIQGIRDGFNTLLAMLRWISDRTDDYRFWENFPEEFPVNVRTQPADPNDPDDLYYSGGWSRVDEVAENIQKILKTPQPRPDGIIYSNEDDRI
jgi:hypothetical protein